MPQRFVRLIICFTTCLSIGSLAQTTLAAMSRSWVLTPNTASNQTQAWANLAISISPVRPGLLTTTATLNQPSRPYPQLPPATKRLSGELESPLQPLTPYSQSTVLVEQVKKYELDPTSMGQTVSRAMRLEPVRLQIVDRYTAETRLLLVSPFQVKAQSIEHRYDIRDFGMLNEQDAGVVYTTTPSTSTGTARRGPSRPATLCVVTSTADNGVGTLRQCLENAGAGDTITFDTSVFPPNNPVTISQASALPLITANNLTVDASDAGVILDGSNLSSGDGFVVLGADGVKIRGLQILHFPRDGVAMAGGATNTTIGGDRSIGSGLLGQGNLISGNGRVGVWLQEAGTMSNTVQGNYIGTDISGTSARGNTLHGVVLGFEATDNIIGGNTSGTWNLISGNGHTGVWLQNIGTSRNHIVSNYIGTDVSGTAAFGNLGHGIFIGSGASNNFIGGTTPDAGNLISGNQIVGVLVLGPDSSGNQIQGNYIGTDATGTTAIGNLQDGIAVASGSSSNVIGGGSADAGNLISGNEGIGILLQDPGTSNNQVLGNYIGADATGTTALGNLQNGIVVSFGALNNVIGGATSGAGNLISGNEGQGIQIQNIDTTGNQIVGNFIGTDVSGTAALGNTSNGIFIADGASNNLVGGVMSGAGNLISGNLVDGILLSDATSNQILGNFIGTDVTGTSALGNLRVGIFLDSEVSSETSNNIIGGNTSGARNLISGNEAVGVLLQGPGTTDNQVLGNYIGTDVSATAALGNFQNGITILFGASNNVIGGTAPGAGNLISGNENEGVRIQDFGTAGNQILGNIIGLDVSGMVAIGNLQRGITILGGASNNIVGGNISATRNLISGNEGSGIWLGGTGTMSNTVQGNFIGTNISGTAVLGNVDDGIFIGFGASNNLIGGIAPGTWNLISGNEGFGIWLQGTGTISNVVQGNFIGTNVSGTAALGNLKPGIGIGFGALNNVIGGDVPGASNLISGNEASGIHIQNIDTTGNQILANFIGTDVSGTTDIGNLGHGVVILTGASNNIVGGNTSATRNLISGNEESGINFQGAGTTDNQILGNFIGTDVAGTAILGNLNHGIFIGFGASNNIIGGITPGVGNLISGNAGPGIQIQNVDTASNQVQGNFIGTNVSGTIALGNTGDGIFIADGASNNTIGGEAAGARNIISGNFVDGIWLGDPGTTGNLIQGNFIGTDVSGTSALGNLRLGVAIASSASNNIIGGPTSGTRNVISSNEAEGILLQDLGTAGNQVLGNYIGTDATGTTALGNINNGILISFGASNNIIGGASPGAGNLISGNNGPGIQIQDIDTTGNQILGNFIGTNISGTVSLGNLKHGVGLGFGASNNVIGGTSLGAGNLISGNNMAGIWFQDMGTTGNQVLGNFIGMDMSGTAALGNLWDGVFIGLDASSNLIGGETISAGNTIVFNGNEGVHIDGNQTLGNTINHNSIYDNEGLGIETINGGNAELTPPTITMVGTASVSGQAQPGQIIEVFSDVNGEGRWYEDRVTTDGGGVFTLTHSGVFSGPNLTATTTDANGNTSQFSDVFPLVDSILTPASITITVSSSATVVYVHTLTNIGPGSDTFTLSATSAQDWLAGYHPSQATLNSGMTATVNVTITVPDDLPDGMVDRTVVTATSGLSPTVVATAEDITIVKRFEIYLPLVVKN